MPENEEPSDLAARIFASIQDLIADGQRPISLTAPLRLEAEITAYVSGDAALPANLWGVVTTLREMSLCFDAELRGDRFVITTESR